MESHRAGELTWKTRRAELLWTPPALARALWRVASKLGTEILRLEALAESLRGWRLGKTTGN